MTAVEARVHIQNTEQHEYRLGEQVVSTKECVISKAGVDVLLHSGEVVLRSNNMVCVDVSACAI